MRKTIAIVALVLVTVCAKSQSQRMVLIEEFNNISAPISASENPELDLWLLSNQDKQIKIQYQTNFPQASGMYSPEVADRIEQYNINVVPTGLIDGIIPDTAYIGFDTTWYAGAPAGFSAEMIENQFLVPSPFEINVDFTITPNNITANASIQCSQAVNGDLKLRLAVIERQVEFSVPPGNNGISQFHNVFRAFIDGSDGITLDNEWETEQTAEFTESIVLPEIFDFSQISVIAFIQDDSNNFVHQAVVNHSGLFESVFANAARIINVELPQELCSENDELTPTITIRNTGSTIISNCEILVNINGTETIQNFNINLAQMADTTLVLEPISFNSESTNTIFLECNIVNNASNEDDDNIFSAEISATNTPLSTFLNVIVNTDCYPEETTWQITSMTGEIAAFGGPYTGQPNTEIITNVELENGCYKFEYFDSAGDGLYGSQWNGCDINGSFSVIDTANTVLFNYDGTVDLAYHSALFEADIINRLTDNLLDNTVRLYPNPATNFIYIETTNAIRKLDFNLYNAVGQNLISKEINLNGRLIEQIDITILPPGLYLIALNIDGNNITKKLIVNSY